MIEINALLNNINAINILTYLLLVLKLCDYFLNHLSCIQNQLDTVEYRFYRRFPFAKNKLISRYLVTLANV